MLVGLSLLWGASFLFIKVAVRELTPATLIMGRLGLAALTLAALAPFTVGTRETLRQLRANAPWLIVIALVNTALAFWLLLVGRDAHRLRPRLDHPGRRPDLQRGARVRLLPRGARDRRPASLALRSASSGSHSS